MILNEPCNPCPPKVITYCVPAPYDPCNPCPPYPQPCPPINTDVNPQYIVSNSIITTGSNVTLATNLVNCNNFIIFNPTTTMTITLPSIASLNNNGKKSLSLVNLSSYELSVIPNDNDSLNGLATATIVANDTLVLHSMKGIEVNGKSSTWVINQ
jgi:hypothetical protein